MHAGSKSLHMTCFTPCAKGTMTTYSRVSGLSFSWLSLQIGKVTDISKAFFSKLSPRCPSQIIRNYTINGNDCCESCLPFALYRGALHSALQWQPVWRCLVPGRWLGAWDEPGRCPAGGQGLGMSPEKRHVACPSVSMLAAPPFLLQTPCCWRGDTCADRVMKG